MGVIEKLEKGNILLVVPLTNINSTWLKNLTTELPLWNVFKEWELFIESNSGRKIFLIHYEGLKPLIKKVQKSPWGLVVFDESQRLKKRTTVQSRLAWRLNSQSKRLALSGTPMDGDPIDLWAQFRFIDPQILGSRWRDFEDRFLLRIGFMGYERKFKNEKMEEFLSLIKPYSIRVLKQDVLNTPEPNIIDVPVNLLGSQRKFYDDLDRDMIAELSDNQVSVELTITQIIRLQQITGGFVKDDRGEIFKVGEAKIRKLKSLLQKINPPIVIFCRFTAEVVELVKICGTLYKNVGELHGGIKDTKGNLARTRVQEDFQSGKLDVLVCQIKTGGVGIDLFKSHNVVFYSTSHSFIDHDQAISRLDRRGQSKQVNIFLIRAINTIDDDIIKAISSKSSVSEIVLNRLKKERIMAEDKKTAPKKAPVKKDAPKKDAPKKSNLPARPEYRYGVEYLAEKQNIAPASVRVALRKAGIKKVAGNTYGWNNKTEVDEVHAKVWPKLEKKAA